MSLGVINSDLYRDNWDRIFGGLKEKEKTTPCDVCPGVATLQYHYSKGMHREDKNRPILPSLICDMHGGIFRRFAGSITSLNINKEKSL